MSQIEGLLLFFIAIILFDHLQQTEKKQVLSKLCNETRQEFSERKSTFDACVTLRSDADSCIRCNEVYLSLQQSFDALNSLAENKTCSDISEEREIIERDEQSWLRLRCSRSG